MTIDGDTGYVKEVGIRNISLQTFDNELIIYPNGELARKKFKNFVLPDARFRVVVNFSVAYGADIDREEEIVLGEVRKIDNVLEDPKPVCIFEEMGDFSLNFQIKFWIPDYNAMFDRKKEATTKIYKALTAAGIDIPFPTHTVYIRKEG